MFSFFKRTTPQNGLAFVDIEVGSDEKIRDLAALRDDDAEFHEVSVRKFLKFIGNAEYLCGHNIIHHDLKYLSSSAGKELNSKAIDTLYWAPLLFPKRPYHRLLKDDKLQSDELNNPLNDCKKAKDLFCDELTAFGELTDRFRQILFLLLGSKEEFTHFFHYNVFTCADADVALLIRQEFEGKLCSNADIAAMAERQPVELAYSLALINADDDTSVTPPWVLHNYPATGNVLHLLRNVPCKQGCPWCSERLDIHRQLKNIFGFDGFRLFGGEPLQENAVRAAVDGKSLVAVFPTGGGKSLTFQLPALMAGRNSRALTVVISPLQSLMKDQVDNLDARGIHEAVTVNGLLDPIERANSFKRVSEGDASILYISPESLRSKTVENILLHRQIARFVVDEAHCFSAWGQDFRVDYLYIADFIRKLQRDKNDGRDIPVSCFTATAKQKVISDIRDYFMKHLSTDMELYTTAETRKNLRYTVLHMESDDHKYNTLRKLLSAKKCPAIVYVSRTKRSRELAERLTHDGIEALPFNGKMDADDKTANQEAFIRNDVQAIVATSAFGMGVDKRDVGLVVHYDISGSLEDYVQESGRAGRDPQTEAECYVLYNDSDLDKHFLLLNQTKLSISEIQQVWAAIKTATKQRPRFSCSPLELARLAGWDDSNSDMETRVKTAVAALENAGFVKRGRNMPRIYATGILVENMQEAARRIDESTQLVDDQRTKAKRIIKSLISSRSRSRAGTEDAESRVDYLADMLGIPTLEIVNIVNLMRQDGILADTKDMSAYIYSADTERKSSTQLRHFAALEEFLLRLLDEGELKINMKELNEQAQEAQLKFCNVKHLRSLLYFLCIAKYIRKEENQQCGMLKITPLQDARELMEKSRRRSSLCDFILNALYAMPKAGGDDKDLVQFSVIGLFEQYKASLLITENVTLAEFEEALLYLSKIGAMKIEGGFIVLYNGMSIERIITDNKIRYTLANYAVLNEFYKMRMQQIHIVGEYANLMVNNMNAALQFVRDYFMIDYNTFINKYFKGQRKKELDRNITSQKYHQLFGSLSPVQSEIINDGESQYIVVAAGPGSGKTRILVHKLAALLLMEDVKHEQLLMLTFSRAAATEFKKRLIELIGGAAYFVEIKTFHSYCFDILGKVGNIEESANIVRDAVSLIRSGEAEQGHITKAVLVIDEAQDMDRDEFALTEALIETNPQMRVIAVGDDDQNIYEFRGSSSQYLQSLADKHDAKMYVLPDNYRSRRNIVELSNQFAAGISRRMKTSPINAVNRDDGTLSLIRHTSPDMEEAVVEQLISTRGDKTCCVLTERNSEALAIHSLLLSKGVPSKLIQSLGGFDLSDLAEMRYFLKQLNADAPTISDERWKAAKEKLRLNYRTSACLPMCERLLKDFSDTRRERYYSDFRLFLKESKYEDFIEGGGNTVLVSTIHKAKGREFDNVYMMLKNVDTPTDEDKRVLYVGMTRTKEALYIHCNTEILDTLPIAPQITVRDNRTYNCPSEIILQLGHRDVVLSYFKGIDKQWLLQNLRSGDSLRVDLPYLCAGNRRVLKLSQRAMTEADKYINSGYRPSSANIRFIVAWKEEGDTEEIPVILPDIRLKRK